MCNSMYMYMYMYMGVSDVNQGVGIVATVMCLTDWIRFVVLCLFNYMYREGIALV